LGPSFFSIFILLALRVELYWKAVATMDIWMAGGEACGVGLPSHLHKKANVMSHTTKPPVDAGPDQALVAQAMGGDKEAFEQLFQIEFPWGFGAACLLTRHSKDAEDLLMTAWERAWERREAFDRRKPFRPWFWTVLRNLWRDEGRRRQRQPPQALDTLRQSTSDAFPFRTIVDDSQLSAESYVALWQAWKTLSDDQRELVILRFSVGYTLNAIAKQWPYRWGATPQSVGHHVDQALAPLRESLEGHRRF
jgi:RNA polymerase sigma-70 factor (ECF subfamily)